MVRTFTAERQSQHSIRLDINGVPAATVHYVDDYGGQGWKVTPTSPNFPRSRKYHSDPISAVIKTYGQAAAKAVVSTMPCQE